MTTTRRPTENDIAEAVERSIREITADIIDGILPYDVNSFSVLHDYVDANEYGGICDDEPDGIDWCYDPELGDAGLDPAYQVQDAVHAWLTARARRLGFTEHTYRPEYARGQVRYGGERVSTPTTPEEN